MTIKHLAWKKHVLLLLILKMSMDTCERKFGPKIAQEIKDDKPLILSKLGQCSGRAGMHMAKGPV